jgi:hypothetical protein
MPQLTKGEVGFWLGNCRQEVNTNSPEATAIRVSTESQSSLSVAASVRVVLGWEGAKASLYLPYVHASLKVETWERKCR